MPFEQSKPTFASVTNVACTCKYLQLMTEDLASPIKFDHLTAEYQIHANGRQIIIYHCPFCGGAAPKSKRAQLFSVVHEKEVARLSNLLMPIETMQIAIEHLGKPDRDKPAGVQTRENESDGLPPSLIHHRAIVYEQLSDVANVWIIEQPNGKVTWALTGKYLGDESNS